MTKTTPNMDFLHAKAGIGSLDDLKTTIAEKLKEVDLNHKKRDFEHLLFNEANAERILSFGNVVSKL